MSELTTEQMIAWLTLEGWEYRPANTEWFASLCRGSLRVIYERTANPWVEYDEFFNNPGCPFSEPAPLTEAEPEFITLAFKHIQENPHD